jgi:hypothetical protein
MKEVASESLYREDPVGEQPRRPDRPSSWVPVAIVIAAFYAGGVSVIVHQWALFWACAGLVEVPGSATPALDTGSPGPAGLV